MIREGAIVWLTGPPASGKTTLARGVVDALHADDVPALWLDSDTLRKFLTPEPSYSPPERDWFYGVIAELALLAASGGVTVVISATAPRRRYRDAVRGRAKRFVEVWVTCSRETLEARDPKGLYAAAHRGEITRLPGMGASYEPPTSPERIVDTDALEPDAGIAAVLDALRQATPAPEGPPPPEDMVDTVR